MAQTRHGTTNRAVEWGYASGKRYGDPFADVELDVAFSGPDDREYRVPAFWAGDHEWRVRFAPPEAGDYEYRTVCSDVENPDLHGREGELHVDAYEGGNDLLARGPLEIDGGRFRHRDGTPFLWVGDTWWLCLSDRIEWPGEFKTLVADRTEQDFSVIQLVAGLFPDMPAFDERGESAAGWAWEADFERINPAFFDLADLKIDWLVRSGLVPCLFAGWGYYLPWMGEEKATRHWRHLIARYGAYPVVWSIAGEVAMPFYLSDDPDADRATQREGWAEVARSVAATDPYGHPITVHPTGLNSGADRIGEGAPLDFDMIQTTHGGHAGVPDATRQIADAPDGDLPVVNGEGFYEGILEGNRQELQRYTFWATMLSGHAGVTYGANGVWQLNREEDPFGPSPHGNEWGDVPWTEAYLLPGSRHVAAGKRILERYDWHRFEPAPEWIAIDGVDDRSGGPFAAGIPGTVRVCYFAPPNVGPGVSGFGDRSVRLVDLDPDLDYRAAFVDPRDGEETPVDAVEVVDGEWVIPNPGRMQDWVVVLEAGSS